MGEDNQGVDEVDKEKEETYQDCEDEEERVGIFSKISAQTIKLILELLCDESVNLVSGFGLVTRITEICSVMGRRIDAL